MRRDVVVAVVFALAVVLDCALNARASGPLWSDVLFYGAAGLTLVWRRRFPVPAVLGALSLVLLGTLAGTDVIDLSTALLCVVIPAYALGQDAQGRIAWAALVAAAAIVVGATAASHEPLTAEGAGFPVGILVAAFACGRLLRDRTLLTRTLADEAARLELDRDLRAQAAVGEERTRIAREMHDVVAHTMAIMVVQAGGARRVLDRDPAAAEQALATVEGTGRVALAELRRLLGFLREDGRAELEPQPSLDGVGGLVARAREAGLKVELRREGTAGELPQGAGLAAYRIVQEALTNTLKHAGPGARARVVLAWTPGALDIEVFDRGGSGGTGEGSGQGLVGMRERVVMYGGSLSAGPDGDGGFAVRASIPRSEVLA
jgi:signal transduction histidine kinase